MTQDVAIYLSLLIGILPRWEWVNPAGAITIVPFLGLILRRW